MRLPRGTDLMFHPFIWDVDDVAGAEDIGVRPPTFKRCVFGMVVERLAMDLAALFRQTRETLSWLNGMLGCHLKDAQ